MSKWYYNKWLYDKKTYGQFQTEMSGTAAVFGRDANINVTFEGEGVYATKDTINFPSLDMSMELDNDTVMLCRGYVDQESGKIRFSDRKLSDKVRSDHATDDPLLYALFDGIETTRTEKKYQDIYPGSYKNLSHSADEQASSFLKSHGFKFWQEAPIEVCAPIALASAIRKEHLEYFGMGLSDCIKCFPDEHRDAFDEWVKEAAGCKSTKESFELAKKIYDLVDPERKSKPKGEDKKGDDGGAGDDQKKEAPLIPGLNGMVEKAFSREKRKDDDENPPYKIWSKKYDRVHHWTDPKTADEKTCNNPKHWNGGYNMRKAADIGAYKRTQEELGPVISVARRKLELMIAAQRRSEWDFTKERGKLDSRRLAAAVAGDRNVFKTKEQAPELDTAISVLVDMSGSMFSDRARSDNGQRRIDVAKDAAIVLFECLSKIGVPFELSGFDCAYSGPQPEIRFPSPDDEDHKYARVEGLHNYIFKGFRDRSFDARPIVAGLATNTYGGHNNADGESLSLVHERLRKRPEKRKILLMLSDGKPHCYAYTEEIQQKTYLKTVIEGIEKQGTHLVCIGIETDHVKDFFKNYAVCKKAADLKDTTLKVLSDILLPKRKRAA